MHHTKIAEFCSSLFHRKENTNTIKNYFSHHPEALILLSELINKDRNYNILQLHFILEKKIEIKILIESFKYKNNINKNNLELIYNSYYKGLIVDNYEKINKNTIENKDLGNRLNKAIEYYFKNIDHQSIKNTIILNKLRSKRKERIEDYYRDSNITNNISNIITNIDSNLFTTTKEIQIYYFFNADNLLLFTKDCNIITNSIYDIKNRKINLYTKQIRKYSPYITDEKILCEVKELKDIFSKIEGTEYFFYTSNKVEDVLATFLILNIQIDSKRVVEKERIVGSREVDKKMSKLTISDCLIDRIICNRLNIDNKSKMVLVEGCEDKSLIELLDLIKYNKNLCK